MTKRHGLAKRGCCVGLWRYCSMSRRLRALQIAVLTILILLVNGLTSPDLTWCALSLIIRVRRFAPHDGWTVKGGRAKELLQPSGRLLDTALLPNRTHSRSVL